MGSQCWQTVEVPRLHMAAKTLPGEEDEMGIWCWVSRWQNCCSGLPSLLLDFPLPPPEQQTRCSSPLFPDASPKNRECCLISGLCYYWALEGCGLALYCRRWKGEKFLLLSVWAPEGLFSESWKPPLQSSCSSLPPPPRSRV